MSKITKANNEKIIGSRAWSNKRYHNLKVNATRRRSRPIEFELTYEDAKKLYDLTESDIARTIDRVDNEKGYTKENSVMACKVCNLLKGKLLKSDTERMLNILKKM